MISICRWPLVANSCSICCRYRRKNLKRMFGGTFFLACIPSPSENLLFSFLSFPYCLLPSAKLFCCICKLLDIISCSFCVDCKVMIMIQQYFFNRRIYQSRPFLIFFYLSCLTYWFIYSMNLIFHNFVTGF